MEYSHERWCHPLLHGWSIIIKGLITIVSIIVFFNWRKSIDILVTPNDVINFILDFFNVFMIKKPCFFCMLSLSILCGKELFISHGSFILDTFLPVWFRGEMLSHSHIHLLLYLPSCSIWRTVNVSLCQIKLVLDALRNSRHPSVSWLIFFLSLRH